jgi:hypothetical protein
MKNAELSINTIVVASIALLVLVVLSVILIQKMGWFNDNTTSCTAQGGVCVEACEEGYSQNAALSCGKQTGLTCCMRMGTTAE